MGSFVPEEEEEKEDWASGGHPEQEAGSWP